MQVRSRSAARAAKAQQKPDLKAVPDANPEPIPSETPKAGPPRDATSTAAPWNRPAQEADPLTPDSTDPTRHELLRRLSREDASFYHVVGRIRDAEEIGAMTPAQADEAIKAARADHERWCQLIRQTWQRQEAATARTEAANER